MKEALDFIMLALFVFFVFMFIKGFNKMQIDKHQKRVDEANKKQDKLKEEKKQ